MKKFCLLAGMLLLLQLSQLQANLLFPTGMPHPATTFGIKEPAPVKASSFIPIYVTNPKDASVTTIYARLQYENEYQSGYGLYGDVVVRFYDADMETPISVSGLTVNYRVIGFNGTSNYDYYSYTVAYGEYHVVASNQEHDYDDGETFRYKDYHIAAGDYIML